MCPCEACTTAIRVSQHIFFHERVGEHRTLHVGAGQTDLVKTDVTKHRTCELTILKECVYEDHVIKRSIQ